MDVDSLVDPKKTGKTVGERQLQPKAVRQRLKVEAGVRLGEMLLPNKARRAHVREITRPFTSSSAGSLGYPPPLSSGFLDANSCRMLPYPFPLPFSLFSFLSSLPPPLPPRPSRSLTFATCHSFSSDSNCPASLFCWPTNRLPLSIYQLLSLPCLPVCLSVLSPLLESHLNRCCCC